MSNDNLSEVIDTFIKVLELTKEGGYNEISQMVGFLVSTDPTYIPRKTGARDLLNKFERDDYLEALVKEVYANNKKCE